MRKRLLPLVALLVTGCAQSQIVPFSRTAADGKSPYAPVPVESVGIFRSTVPFAKFTELGLISFRDRGPYLDDYYEQIRKDAAEYGAQAVVGVKLTHETHEETHTEEKCTTVTDCNFDGTVCSSHDDCHSEDVTESVTTFLCTGSMIREVK